MSTIPNFFDTIPTYEEVRQQGIDAQNRLVATPIQAKQALREAQANGTHGMQLAQVNAEHAMALAQLHAAHVAKLVSLEAAHTTNTAQAKLDEAQALAIGLYGAAPEVPPQAQPRAPQVQPPAQSNRPDGPPAQQARPQRTPAPRSRPKVPPAPRKVRWVDVQYGKPEEKEREHKHNDPTDDDEAIARNLAAQFAAERKAPARKPNSDCCGCKEYGNRCYVHGSNPMSEADYNRIAKLAMARAAMPEKTEPVMTEAEVWRQKARDECAKRGIKCYF